MNLQEEIKALKRRISELEEQDEREREFPRFMDVYYYIQSSGRVDNVNWSEDVTDFQIKGMGNVFKTEEEAEFAVEKLKVEAELRKFSKSFKEDDDNYFIQINSSHNNIVVDDDDCYQTQGTIYFESKFEAHDAIQIVGEDRIKKYIFGVEE